MCKMHIQSDFISDFFFMKKAQRMTLLERLWPQPPFLEPAQRCILRLLAELGKGRFRHLLLPSGI